MFSVCQGILINGQFPGPTIESVTNDNVIVNIMNNLDEPFLISWSFLLSSDTLIFCSVIPIWSLLISQYLLESRNGIQQRRNSWQDGVYGTNCPIPPGQNFTYILQFKDQIGSFFYFPSLAFHKAAGGVGGIKISSRPMIPVPFPAPAGDFTILSGDWFIQNHTVSIHHMLQSL